MNAMYATTGSPCAALCTVHGARASSGFTRRGNAPIILLNLLKIVNATILPSFPVSNTRPIRGARSSHAANGCPQTLASRSAASADPHPTFCTVGLVSSRSSDAGSVAAPSMKMMVREPPLNPRATTGPAGSCTGKNPSGRRPAAVKSVPTAASTRAVSDSWTTDTCVPSAEPKSSGYDGTATDAFAAVLGGAGARGGATATLARPDASSDCSAATRSSASAFSWVTRASIAAGARVADSACTSWCSSSAIRASRRERRMACRSVCVLSRSSSPRLSGPPFVRGEPAAVTPRDMAVRKRSADSALSVVAQSASSSSNIWSSWSATCRALASDLIVRDTDSSVISLLRVSTPWSDSLLSSSVNDEPGEAVSLSVRVVPPTGAGMDDVIALCQRASTRWSVMWPWKHRARGGHWAR
eukprot:m.319176 g.319176  ORF g.319176 m.319176 type:complete len:414 (+) comp27586_c0_seq2:3250-4491(+)